MLKQLLAGADGDLQAILCRSDRTGPHFVVRAIGVVSEIEIHEETIARQ